MNTQPIIVVALVAAITGCTQTTVDPAAQGAALLAPFKQGLKNELVTGMESGPVAAISTCSIKAPVIADGLSVDGVVMGRSSHKLRNAANVAPEWAATYLEAYAAGEQDGPVAIEYEEGRFGYIEPIKTQLMCLNCHGTQLHPDVAAALEELYPDDKATGFSEGDFRGVFWVEFPGT